MKVRIWIEFSNKDAAEDWLMSAKGSGFVPDGAKAFPVDGLDRRARSVRDYILRRESEARQGVPLKA